MSSNPCHGCAKRWVKFDENGKAITCHSDCPDHEAWLQKREKANAKRREEQQASNNIADMVYLTKKRTKFYKRKK